MSARVRTRRVVAAASALLVAVPFVATSVTPAAAKQSKSHALKIQKINVANEAGVPANAVVEMTFTAAIRPASATPASVQIRARNASNTGYTRQVFGSISVAGNVVRFFPRLPGHRRQADGTFFPEGSAADDAQANAGFQPSKFCQLRIIGNPNASPLRSTTGAPLSQDVVARFGIASNASPSQLWTTEVYNDSPPPRFSFSNPPDRVPSAQDQYSRRGGSIDVPTKTGVALFCTKVPLAPGTARVSGNVDLTMTSRSGDTSLRRPVDGSVFVEQNFDTTLLQFAPHVALADRATYRLRVTKGVKDLTETNEFATNRDRERLRSIYDWLAAGRVLNPTLPAADLVDPPGELIPEWPPGDTVDGAIQRGIFKANILALGDAYPDEIDPRTMVIFTTQDEPVTEDKFTVEFTRGENLTDPLLSTGTVDTEVPGAAAAVFTAAAGSGADGDLTPTSGLTLSTDNFPGGEMNFRRVSIPAGVTVTLTGSRPAVLKSLTLSIDGTLSADGAAGQNSSTSPSTTPITSQPQQLGGAGGPGGGRGGDSNTSATSGTGGVGRVGADSFGNNAAAPDGGRPGQGGQMASNSVTYAFGGGGGGGGGVRTAGATGAASLSGTASWNGQGGLGGAAALGNDDLSPLVGAGGGGAGANGSWQSGQWVVTGGAGGGAGGAMLVQTAGTLTVGTTGVIRARGGAGGNGPNSGNGFPGGPGGGGGGGSVLLRTTKGFNVANPGSALNVSGGAGGTQSGGGAAPFGGRGGEGLVRTEDPNGGIAAPGSSQGLYNPVGAGVPSVVYTKFVDLGVQDPRLLPYVSSDIATGVQNDAVLVEAQMTRESTTAFGKPDLSKITATQDSGNLTITSAWTPIKLHDETRLAAGAFGAVPGLPAAHATEFTGFPIAALNGHGYRFIRFRVRFQLDATQTASSPLPVVDRITTHFQFNY